MDKERTITVYFPEETVSKKFNWAQIHDLFLNQNVAFEEQQEKLQIILQFIQGIISTYGMQTVTYKSGVGDSSQLYRGAPKFEMPGEELEKLGLIDTSGETRPYTPHATSLTFIRDINQPSEPVTGLIVSYEGTYDRMERLRTSLQPTEDGKDNADKLVLPQNHPLQNHPVRARFREVLKWNDKTKTVSETSKYLDAVRFPSDYDIYKPFTGIPEEGIFLSTNEELSPRFYNRLLTMLTWPLLFPNTQV
jgi:hypothetical protein